VKLVGAARLWAVQALWKRFGIEAAGRRLVRALGSDDEDLATTAGMLIVQGGRRTVPLLREALARRENLPLVLRIAGDIGARELGPDIERFAGDRDPAVAEAARDALRLLAET
jgi:hypothetical protein